MPTESTIKTLCEYFDVDILKGTQEFKKAHQEWDAKLAGNRKCVLSQPTATPAPDEPKEQESKPEGYPLTRSEIYSKLYSKVPCDEFLKIKELVDKTPDNTNLFELIYGEVSCRTFITVYRTFMTYLQESGV